MDLFIVVVEWVAYEVRVVPFTYLERGGTQYLSKCVLDLFIAGSDTA